MDKISIVSFRYHAKFGHFRKPYSNVSSLSYPFPPRTALAGLIGAILGVPKAEVPLRKELFNSLLDRFIDLRMFGSPLAFKGAPADWGETSKVTGPIQINFGETLHKVEEVTFHGTSIFRSKGEEEE